MKKIFSLVRYIMFSLIILTGYIIVQKPLPSTYKINLIEDKIDYILDDDFKTELNNDYWSSIEKGNNYNNELQYYSTNNVEVKDNLLKLVAKKELLNNHGYTSGFITTKLKFEFLYGKIIFKAKPAVGQGLLSAVWLLPADGSLFPEIDIIEVLGQKPNEIWTGVHYIDDYIKKSDFGIYKKTSDDYAIYELHWEKDSISWYIDGKLVHWTNKGVPNKKMYLIINLAVGGNWPKRPTDNIFPTEFSIDYIYIIPQKEAT